MAAARHGRVSPWRPFEAWFHSLWSLCVVSNFLVIQLPSCAAPSSYRFVKHATPVVLHPKPSLCLTHDLLRVLSMDTWWNFGHELKKKSCGTALRLEDSVCFGSIQCRPVVPSWLLLAQKRWGRTRDALEVSGPRAGVLAAVGKAVGGRVGKVGWSSSIKGGALSAVRAQCNYLGVWPY